MRRSHFYFLVSIAIVLIGVIGVGVFMLGQPHRFPIRTVKFYGDYEYLTKAQLTDLLNPYLEAHSFYAANSGYLEKQLDALPVVKYAEVRRQWPDTLKIKLHTRVPVAVWNNASLLAESGDIFPGTPGPSWQYLPHFVGAKKQVKDMLKQYQTLSKILEGEHLYIKSFDCTDQGSEQLELIPGGFWIYLGYRDQAARLKRFVQAYPVLIHQRTKEKLAYIDMRYRQGLAVRWARVG